MFNQAMTSDQYHEASLKLIRELNRIALMVPEKPEHANEYLAMMEQVRGELRALKKEYGVL